MQSKGLTMMLPLFTAQELGICHGKLTQEKFFSSDASIVSNPRALSYLHLMLIFNTKTDMMVGLWRPTSIASMVSLRLMPEMV